MTSGLLILFGLEKALETELVRILPPPFVVDWAGRL